jgi:beta-lactamase class A
VLVGLVLATTIAGSFAEVVRGAAPQHLPRGSTTTTTTSSAADPFTTPAVRRFLAGRQGKISAAVYDWNTGRTYCYRRNASEQTASVIKVDILATLLAEAQRAHRVLTVGERALAVSMIEHSDNHAAQALWNDVGGANAVARFDARIGMLDTTPNPLGYWGLSTTTACDQVTLLRRLAYPNPILATTSRSRARALMSEVEPDQRWGITAGVPPAVRVAVKNGWLPVADGWQINSDGIVHGRGRRYVVSIMTAENPSQEYGIETIEALSRSLWHALALHPGRIGPATSLEPSDCPKKTLTYCEVLNG